MSKVINFKTKTKQADLMARIRESLNKINRLMAELGAVNTKEESVGEPSSLYVVK